MVFFSKVCGFLEKVEAESVLYEYIWAGFFNVNFLQAVESPINK